MAKSFLSAGEVIHKLLTSDKGVSSIVGNKVFPIARTEAPLPYICYQREGAEQTPTKSINGSTPSTMKLACYAESYKESVALAEAVREALDNKTAEVNGLVMRGCYLVDAEELWGNDAYWQILTFRLRF